MEMFSELPRWIGFPNQIYVTSEFARDSLINKFNGKTPCFLSTFVFPSKQEMIVDRATFDLDSKLSLRIPYKDTKKLKYFAEKNEIPYRIVFSGGKGFHFYIFFKPEKGNDEIKTKLYSLQDSLVKALKIEAIDYPTIGRLRWLIRIPTTVYVNGNMQTNGNYCRWIPKDDFELGLKHIIKIAKTPGELPKKPKPKHTLNEICELIPNYTEKQQFNGLQTDFDLTQGGILTPTLEALGVPCLQRQITANEPSELVRMETTCFLKFLGYRDISIIGFFKSLKWRDWNKEKTSYKIRQMKPRLPNCKKLRYVLGEENCKDCSFRRKK